MTHINLRAFSSAELLEKAMEREINLWTAPTLPLLIIFAGPMVDFPLCSKLIILSSIFEIKKWQMGIPRFFGAISDEPLLRLILGDACWHCSSHDFFSKSCADLDWGWVWRFGSWNSWPPDWLQPSLLDLGGAWMVDGIQKCRWMVWKYVEPDSLTLF